MKKQKQYSLTAKERKQLRKAGVDLDPRTPEEIEAEEKAKAEAGKKRKRIALIVGVSVLALLLIATAIFLPIYMSKNKYAYINNPVAVISLDNGDKLRFEIFEDTCPVAATNFLFLARIGYFNGTILFDNQNDWVRFGGFEGPAAADHRSKNEDFCEKISGLKERSGSKFGYRLKKDTSSYSNVWNQAGVLSFMYADTATEFQVSFRDNTQTLVQGTSSSRDYRVTAVGRALDDGETLANIEAIAKLTQLKNSPHSTWKAPVADETSQKTIKIESVKLYNMQKSKWKHFVFDEYMSKIMDGSSAITN